MKPLRLGVNSTALRSVGYDPTTKILEIEFTDGTIYEYFPVPENVHQELMAAQSKGTYFEDRVRQRYIHRRSS